MLFGKIAVVTGGARDIGKAIAMKLALAGAKVVIHYNQAEEQARATLDEITSSGGVASLFQGDITKKEQVNGLVQHTGKFYGDKLDVLVNNAGGIIGRRRLEEMDDRFYDAVMDVNFRSLFMVTRAFHPHLVNGSSIINISSLSARDGGGMGASLYGASKGAVSTFTRGLSKELGPQGIRVNSICPGLIDTTFHDMFTADEVRTKVAAATPLRREGTAQEVADLVVFLASSQSSFITGANYDINGGIAFS